MELVVSFSNETYMTPHKNLTVLVLGVTLLLLSSRRGYYFTLYHNTLEH